MITAFINSIAVETFIIGTEMQLHADVVLWFIALCSTHFQAGGRTSRSSSKCSRLSSTYSSDLSYLISFVSVATISSSVALLGSEFHCAVTPTTVKNVFSSNINVPSLIQTWFFLQYSCSEAYKRTTPFNFFFSLLSFFSFWQRQKVIQTVKVITGQLRWNHWRWDGWWCPSWLSLVMDGLSPEETFAYILRV